MRTERHFIFGYGSLICHRSRAITAPSLMKKPAIPVVVEHLTRTWSARISHTRSKKLETNNRATTNSTYSAMIMQGRKDDQGHNILGQTAMGIEHAKNETCSGVLIEVDEDELEFFDRREGGYDRVEIDLLHVWGLDNYDSNQFQEENEKEEELHEVLQHANMKRRASENDMTIGGDSDRISVDDSYKNHDNSSFKIWVYIPKNPIPPNQNFPIMQSYVDIIFRGCLDYDHHFLTTFLTTTHGWWYHNEDKSSSAINVSDYDLKTYGPTLETQNKDHFTWIEDRDDPFYVRADSIWSKEKGEVVDKYLQNHLPLAFTKRRALDKILVAVEKYEDEFD